MGIKAAGLQRAARHVPAGQSLRNRSGAPSPRQAAAAPQIALLSGFSAHFTAPKLHFATFNSGNVLGSGSERVSGDANAGAFRPPSGNVSGAEGQETGEEAENELFRGCPAVGGTRRVQQVFPPRRRKPESHFLSPLVAARRPHRPSI